jgi:hypothetical protein
MTGMEQDALAFIGMGKPLYRRFDPVNDAADK